MSFHLKPLGHLFLALTLYWSQAALAEPRFSLPSGQRTEPRSEIERLAYTDIQEGETLLWLLEDERGHQIFVEESFRAGLWERKLHVFEGAEATEPFNVSDYKFDDELGRTNSVQIIQPEEEGAWKEFINGTLGIPEGLGAGLGSLSFETERLKVKGGFRLPPRLERDPDATLIQVIRAEIGFTIKF